MLTINEDKQKENEDFKDEENDGEDNRTVERNRDLIKDGTNESHQEMDFSNDILSNEKTEEVTLNEDRINEDLSRIQEEEDEEPEPVGRTLQEILQSYKESKSVEQLVTDYTIHITAYMSRFLVTQEKRINKVMDKMEGLMTTKINEINMNVEEVAKTTAEDVISDKVSDIGNQIKTTVEEVVKTTIKDVVKDEVMPELEARVKTTAEEYCNERYERMIKDRDDVIEKQNHDLVKVYKELEKAVNARETTIDMFFKSNKENKEQIKSNTKLLNDIADKVTGEDTNWIIEASGVVAANVKESIKEEIPTAREIADRVREQLKQTIPKTIASPKPRKRSTKSSESEDESPPKSRKKSDNRRQASPSPQRQPTVVNRVEYSKLAKTQSMPKFKMETDAEDWIETFERKATIAEWPEYHWPAKMTEYMDPLQEKAYFRFYGEYRSLIEDDSSDWWQTYKEKFLDRLGSIDKRTRAMQSLEKIKFNSYKDNEKNRFFEDVLRAAEKTGDKTSETIAYKVLDKLDDTYYRQVVSSGKDLFKLPVDQFVRRLQEVWDTEEVIRMRPKATNDRQSDKNTNPFRDNNQRFGQKGNGFQRTQNLRNNRNENRNDKQNEYKRQTTGQSEDRLCFLCNKKGHLRKDCYQNKPQMSDRTKPLPVSTIDEDPPTVPGNGKR